MPSTESTITENKLISFSRGVLLSLVVWLLFWIAFFAFKTDSDPLLGVILVTWSAIAVFILPFLLSVVIIFRIVNLRQPNSDITEFSDFTFFSRLGAAVLLSFAY